MALSVVYFRIMHHLGRPHYVWDEYLYSVLQEVEVRVTVCAPVCVVLSGMMMKGREKVKPVPAQSLLFSKSTKEPPGLTSPSDGRIAIKSSICLLNKYTI